MCTLTLLRDDQHFKLTINRDEHKARAAELPPEVSHASATDVSLLMPRDSQAGGSWVGTNDRGLLAALLNFYGDSTIPLLSGSVRVSRGEIVPTLLSKGDYADACGWLLGAFDPSQFAPFTLVFADNRRGKIVRWYGNGRLEWSEIQEDEVVLTSSGWNSARVEAWRRKRFADWQAGGRPFTGPLPDFHLLAPAELKSWGPLMDRAEACTRSITQIRRDLRSDNLELEYWARPEAGVLSTSIQKCLNLGQSKKGTINFSASVMHREK